MNNNKTVSPPLVTIREYGRWFENTFDNSISQLELYMHSKKSSGETVLEKHPGTKIGTFFRNTRVSNDKLVSWIIPPDSKVVDRLVRQGMVERVDARLELKTYTVDQIEFYLRSNVDSSINMATECLMPIQIKVSDGDLADIQKPALKQRNKKLF